MIWQEWFRDQFLSTPSARRATQKQRKQRRQKSISIHALREEGDPGLFYYGVSSNRFLSTPSARRATCSERKRSGSKPISIHALREEGDQ